MEPVRMYRQGDVLVVALERIPPRAVPIHRDAGRVVLAYGEATGHAHSIADEGAQLLTDDGDTFLRVTAAGGVALTHEEHRAIVVPPGDYAVVRQREYTPTAARPVAD